MPAEMVEDERPLTLDAGRARVRGGQDAERLLVTPELVQLVRALEGRVEILARLVTHE
jgi:hypothetical protein